MIQWNYDRNRNLIEAKFSGPISFQEIQDHVKSLGRIENLPDRLNILDDFTEADYKLLFKSRKGMKVLRDIRSRMPKYKLVKEAIIQNNPYIAAFSFLYRKFFTGTRNYQIRVFSTRKAALEWLEE